MPRVARIAGLVLDFQWRDATCATKPSCDPPKQGSELIRRRGHRALQRARSRARISPQIRRERHMGRSSAVNQFSAIAMGIGLSLGAATGSVHALAIAPINSATGIETTLTNALLAPGSGISVVAGSATYQGPTPRRFSSRVPTAASIWSPLRLDTHAQPGEWHLPRPPAARTFPSPTRSTSTPASRQRRECGAEHLERHGDERRQRAQLQLQCGGRPDIGVGPVRLHTFPTQR